MPLRRIHTRRTSQTVQPLLRAAVVTAIGIVGVAAGAYADRSMVVGSEEARADPAIRKTDARAFEGKSGPWGRLRYLRIYIQPPAGLLDAESDHGHPRWFFKTLSRKQTEKVLLAANPPVRFLEILGEQRHWRETSVGTWVRPSDEAVLTLDPRTRLRIYRTLAEFPQNGQRYPVAMRPDAVGERMRSSGLSPRTLALWQKLLYPSGSWVLFADTQLMLGRLPEPDERRRFIRMLAGNATYLVSLQTGFASDVEAMARYWSFPGGAKDRGQLLNSLSRVPGGTELDLVHLLPPIARRRIYTYAKPTPGGVADHRNCFWTSMNFFSDTPHDHFSDPQVMMKELEAAYEKVVEPTFGDVILLLDARNQPIHAASYLADNLVFTRNGQTSFHPWIYATMEELQELYSAILPRSLPFTVNIYRRRGRTP